MKKSKGVWKKERAIGRKFSRSDAHKTPKSRTRKKYWVGSYHRGKKQVKESWRTNPNYKKANN